MPLCLNKTICCVGSKLYPKVVQLQVKAMNSACFRWKHSSLGSAGGVIQAALPMINTFFSHDFHDFHNFFLMIFMITSSKLHTNLQNDCLMICIESACLYKQPIISVVECFHTVKVCNQIKLIHFTQILKPSCFEFSIHKYAISVNEHHPNTMITSP